MAKETLPTIGKDVPIVTQPQGGATQIIMPDPVVDNDKPIRSFEIPPATPQTIEKKGQPTQVIL